MRTSQNWFLVIVEFVIVVVSVYMGLQVQDWNDERKERIAETELLVRLYEETQELREAHWQKLENRRVRADTPARSGSAVVAASLE